MGQSLFGYVSSIALFSYLFLLLLFLNTVRNKAINAFIVMLTSLIFWTGGSLMMRLMAWPNYVVWYHVSLGGLMLMILAYFQFITALVNQPQVVMSRVYAGLLGLCFVVNIPNGLLLHWPSVVGSGGQVSFVYDRATPWVAVLFGLSGIVVVHMMTLVVASTRGNRRLLRQLTPVVWGIIILFVGNLAIMFPALKGFPADIAAGVVNAGLLMYALVRNQLFKVRTNATNRFGHIISLAVGFAVFYTLRPNLEWLLGVQLSIDPKYHLWIYLGIFSTIVYGLIFLWNLLATFTFIRDEVQHNEAIKSFSFVASNNLSLDAIVHAMIGTIRDTVGVEKIYLGFLDHGTDKWDHGPSRGTCFTMRYSANILTDLAFSLRCDNPLVEKLQACDDLVNLDDFKHQALYKSMWNVEKLQLERLEATYAFGIRENEHSLVGIVLFSDMGRKSRLKPQDFDFIVSIFSVASIAIKNAHAYEKALIESRTDELTGVYNRRYFYELVPLEYDKSRESSLVLMLLSLDDFKLFNQLYGVKQGDRVLLKAAQIIKASVGHHGIVARYSGKEFAILLPGYDAYAARKLCESLQQQFSELGNEPCGTSDKEPFVRHKRITISAGISISPYGASSVKELISNAEQAVYHVKRMGKNGFRIFDTFIKQELSGGSIKPFSEIYNEYEATIVALTAAIDAKDHYTFNHSQNVAKYSVALAHALNLNPDIVENIRQAALLHDIGKIAITELVLNKPGRLTNDEFLVMQGHVEASIDIIRHLPSLDYVIPAVLSHHERYDGTGYPRRISGEDIPITGRILCIADAFDAIVSERCYKPSIPFERAIEILRAEAGRQFDPDLVTPFIALLEQGLYENPNKLIG